MATFGDRGGNLAWSRTGNHSQRPGPGKTIVTDDRADGPTADPPNRPGDPSRPVTIACIAESAGVSVPTVSKVLNGRSGVSADTPAKVEAAHGPACYPPAPP